jgi:hypothetical protein
MFNVEGRRIGCCQVEISKGQGFATYAPSHEADETYDLQLTETIVVNCDNDRETAGYTALDYVQAIVDSLNNASNKTKQNTQLRVRTGIRSKSSRLYEHNRLITHLIYLEGGRVEVDELQLMVSISSLLNAVLKSHWFRCSR